MEIALEAGAEDVKVEDGIASFYGDATEFIELKGALESAGYDEFLTAEISYVPQSLTDVPTIEEARKLLKLIEALEDNEDVQTVSGNFRIDPEWLDELGA